MSTIRSTSTPATGKTAQPAPVAKQAQTTQATPAPSGTAKPACEHVAQRAYEKWMKRGCVHGFDVQDWAEAEQEVMAEQSRSTSSSTGARR